MIQSVAPLLPPRAREWGREILTSVQHTAQVASLWNWEFATIDAPGLSVDILFLGRRSLARLIAPLLGIARLEASTEETRSLGTVVMSEVPMPYALCVPTHLSVSIPLRRPLEAILAEYDAELRRRVRKLQPSYSWRRVEDDAEIERIERDMLVPFANARHAERATHVALADVLRVAKTGRLDLLSCDGEIVGAHLGHSYFRKGRRNWTTLRFGYPEHVFGNAKRLADANTMNVQLALAYAIAEGYDAYDLGRSLARPDGGLLQFKRRRKGFLDAHGMERLYVRIPRECASRMLAVSPLFSLRGEAIFLEVGVTATTTDEELVARFREWRFAGLAGVRLHSERAIHRDVRDAIREHYRDRGGLETIDIVR